MQKETLWKELFQRRKLLFENYGEILKANEEDLNSVSDGNMYDYFLYLNNHNVKVEKFLNYRLELYKTDCSDMRNIFLLEKLNEVSSKNRIVCLYALYDYSKHFNLNIEEFITLMDKSSYWNDNTDSRSIYRKEAFMKVKDIRDKKLLKTYIQAKIEHNTELCKKIKNSVTT